MKFGRTYHLFIQGQTADHTMDDPLTLRFRVTNNTLFSSGQAVLQIYNLTQDVRNDLYKDAYEYQTYKQIILAAGYVNEPSVPIIFQGNVMQASSYRQGPDWITEIIGLDGGFAIDNGIINLTKPNPYTFENVMSDIVKQMPHLTLGKIGVFDVKNSRGISMAGNAWYNIIKRVAPYQAQAFINKEVVNIVNQWEYVAEEGLLETISADTGMIGTPRVQDGLVKARMIFEPRLEVGQKVSIESSEIPSNRSGDFKVFQLLHSGTISGAVCEELITEATIYQPNRTLQEVA